MDVSHTSDTFLPPDTVSLTGLTSHKLNCNPLIKETSLPDTDVHNKNIPLSTESPHLRKTILNTTSLTCQKWRLSNINTQRAQLKQTMSSLQQINQPLRRPYFHDPSTTTQRSPRKEYRAGTPIQCHGLPSIGV